MPPGSYRAAICCALSTRNRINPRPGLCRWDWRLATTVPNGVACRPRRSLAPRSKTLPLVVPEPRLVKLLDKRFVFVTGKGGVGKTTVAAALGRLAAARGKNVLLVEIDTQPSMGRLFGDKQIGYEPTRLEANIWACNLTGADCMRSFVRRFVPGDRIADLILKNRVAQIFFESAPSVTEAVILDQLATLARQTQPRFDFIAVDLPASGHAVTFLNVPRSMSDMVRVGELAGHMRELAALLADPAQAELLLVSLPEEMSVNETIELWEKARARVATRLHGVVFNQEQAPALQPDDHTQLAALAAHEGVDQEALQRVMWGVALGSWWKERDAETLQRLTEAVDGKVIRVPFRPKKVSERDLVEQVASVLNMQLGGA